MRRPCGLGLRPDARRDSGLDPAPARVSAFAETCRFARWPQERQALAAAKSLRLVARSPAASFCLLVFGRVAPGAREEETIADWQKRPAYGFPAHHP
ncbi:MAG: hypothetical protein M9963_09030 [Kiritimatiellae bacterium]|nr:hypothetical protein [Kiritimatiellia bacterium]